MEARSIPRLRGEYLALKSDLMKWVQREAQPGRVPKTLTIECSPGGGFRVLAERGGA